jgi:hypothetical protein
MLTQDQCQWFCQKLSIKHIQYHSQEIQTRWLEEQQRATLSTVTAITAHWKGNSVTRVFSNPATGWQAAEIAALQLPATVIPDLNRLNLMRTAKSAMTGTYRRNCWGMEQTLLYCSWKPEVLAKSRRRCKVLG